ncbi:MAG: WYL domain-containing protein [Cyanobacteria bacterium J06634_6]
MGRKGRSVTLSLSDGDKAQLEQLALDFDMTWGDRANISKLIEAIARKTLTIAKNHDWTTERIEALSQARMLLVDKGKIQDAIAIAKLLISRSELTIPMRREIEKFLDRDIRPWRVQVERFINRQQPFRLSYQDAAENLWQFTVHYAKIVPREEREYLECWCVETTGSKDLPEFEHNRTLRLDRITEAAVSAVKASWRDGLDAMEVEMRLYGGLAAGYRSKQGRDILVEWQSEPPQTLKVVRRITSTFWFERAILRYGADCEVVGPTAVREKMGAIARSMAQRYQT